MDQLRELVIHFVIDNPSELAGSNKFLALVEEGGPFQEILSHSCLREQSSDGSFGHRLLQQEILLAGSRLVSSEIETHVLYL